VNRRDQIAMSSDEVRAFLQAQRIVICATNGANGWPHLMPLWFTTRDDDVWAWTFGKSQKVRNLERDPRATLQVETGESYNQLRGVMIEADTVIHRDQDLILEFGLELFSRYNGGGRGEQFREVVRKQAAKRVALQFRPRRVASFDHRKLAGAY
jgi:PPOX class probable F420-dependent enzyme